VRRVENVVLAVLIIVGGCALIVWAAAALALVLA
jgi:hypothetical protein